MAVRKFTLYNSLGESLNLLDNVDMWGMNPEGLGIQIQNEVTSAGTHFVLNARTLQVPQFSISMLYGIETGDAYKRYSEMVAFLEHVPITLEYKTDAGEWRRDCTLNELTKTEIKETGVMTESFKLDCLTPWYKEVTAQSDTREPISDDGKIYLPYDESAATYAEPPTGKVNKGSLVKYDGIQKYPGDGRTLRFLVIGCDSVETADDSANFLGIIEAEIYSSGSNVASGTYVRSLTGDTDLDTNLQRVVDGVSNVNTNYGYALPNDDGKCVMVVDLGEFQRTESSRFKLDWGFSKTYKNLWAGFASYREEVVYDTLDISYKTEFGDVSPTDLWLDLVYPPQMKTGYYIATRTLPYLDMRYMSYYAEKIEPLEYDRVYDYEYTEGLNPDLLGKTFTAYTYDYIYEDIVDGSEGVFKVNNESMHMGLQEGSPVRIEITGPCENPYWQVIQDYKIVATDGFKVNIPADYKLVVDSSPGKQEAMLVSPSGDETKMYQYQQLNYTNFVMVPKGRSTLLFFNCDKVKFVYREERVVV